MILFIYFYILGKKYGQSVSDQKNKLSNRSSNKGRREYERSKKCCVLDATMLLSSTNTQLYVETIT